MHEEVSFLVLYFDGKSMYEEIIRATEEFDSILHREQRTRKRRQSKVVIYHHNACEETPSLVGWREELGGGIL
ncbi:hypothetical protein ACFX13_020556 [Malus domestica]